MLSYLAEIESSSWIDWVRLGMIAMPLAYLYFVDARREHQISVLIRAGLVALLARAVLDVTDEFPSFATMPIFGAADPLHPFYKDVLAGILGLGLLTTGVYVEVIQRRRTDEMLLKEQWFRNQVLSSLEAGVIVLGNKDEVLYINPKAAEIVGAYKQETAGETNSQPRLQPSPQNELPQTNGTTGVYSADGKTLQMIEKSFPANAQGLPEITIQTLWDVSPWEESRRLSQEFISAISHELRTPLTSIKGYLELVLDDGTLASEHRDYLQIVQSSATRLVSLVEELLDLSRIESGIIRLDLRVQDVGPVIREAVEYFATEYKAKCLTLRLDIPQKPVLVETDHERLLQILCNLLSNACKYTPEQGEVTVQLKESDGEITIAVKDTGIGISEPQQPKIFTRFFRTTESRLLQIKGTGLGLAITKSLVEKLGGSISFTSVEGQGSAFTVALPKTEEQSAEKTAAKETSLIA